MSNPLLLSEWPSAPGYLELKNNEVHVLVASLDIDAPRLQSLIHILSSDEKERGERFRFNKERHRYIASRGILREILSFYLGCDPSILRFEYNSFGKPFLKRSEGMEDISFNLSHSQDISLYALTQRRKVGIDIEKISSTFVEDCTAEYTFSPGEVVMLRSLPEEVQNQAFFSCWTRKEAYIKAKGQGLSIPIDQFDVSLAPGEPAQLLETKWDDDEPSRWKFMDLKVNPDYAAAVTAEGNSWHLEWWRWF